MTGQCGQSTRKRSIDCARWWSPEDVEAFAAVVEEFVHVALHSTLVVIDGGTASAVVGRVRLVDEASEQLGDGLHELFVDHLFDTGRMV